MGARRLMQLTMAVAVAVVSAVPAAGQTSAYTPPRTEHGQPDLQGIWQVLNTAAWDIEDHNASLGVPAGRAVVEGDGIPYQPWALEQRQENYANRATLDPEHRCLLSGIPRITYMPYPFQIVQQADKVNILYEYNHSLRQIYMNGNSHPAGPINWWMGDSRGSWDGETLVVDVVHFTDETWFDRAGNFHSEALHVVERYTATSPNHLLYEATIEDPAVFTRPWKMSMTLYRRMDPTPELLEYECYAYMLEENWPN